MEQGKGKECKGSIQGRGGRQKARQGKKPRQEKQPKERKGWELWREGGEEMGRQPRKKPGQRESQRKSSIRTERRLHKPRQRGGTRQKMVPRQAKQPKQKKKWEPGRMRNQYRDSQRPRYKYHNIVKIGHKTCI